METAPKDGSEILAWRWDCGIILVRWTSPECFCTEDACEKMGECAEQEDWFCADFWEGSRLEGSEVPTHWTPLPPEPVDA